MGRPFHFRKLYISLFKTVCSPLRALSVALLAMGAIGSANAGFVTTNEAGLDAVYGQASFGASPIDIRFDSAITIYNSEFVNIDSGEEMDALGALGVNSPIVSAFFVDDINFCGVALPGIAGCAGVPGNFLVIASALSGPDGFDYGPNAPQNVIGHELGHNLGLDHDETEGNLLNASLQQTFGFLLPYQVAIILASPLVQIDGNGQRFIEIQPYAVVASVPEPSTYLMMGLGLGIFAFIRNRKSNNA
jgi:hypothetical protein